MTKTTTKKRNRRTPEQMIADLEAKIAGIKRQAAARKARATDGGKAFLAAVKAVDQAIKAAASAGNQEMQHALETARAALSEHLVRMGVRVPAARRGQRRRSA